MTPYSRLSWVLSSCTLRRSVEHTSSDCIWGFSQSVPTSDSQVTSASGLSVWCCAGRAENGRTRDWLIRADKIKLQYKKEPAGHLNLMTLTCWFLFCIYFIMQASEACIPPFASPFQNLQTSYSVSLLKSHYISVTKYLKYMKHLQ